jgi:L-seryl-tRNA(Ser) seleniumtransferase
MTLAALEATLLHYLKGEAEVEVPVWRMLSASVEELRARSEAWAATLQAANIQCGIVTGESTIGGGSLPGDTLPTMLLSIPSSEAGAGKLAATLRSLPTPVIARVERGALLIDPRTILPHQEQELLESLKTVVSGS